MTEASLDIPVTETSIAVETTSETSGKPVTTSKVKPKPAARPKPVGQNNDPVYLLLFPNGKYKELRESDLTSEAADVLKDQSLRLVKGHHLIPQISFKSAVE